MRSVPRWFIFNLVAYIVEVIRRLADSAPQAEWLKGINGVALTLLIAVAILLFLFIGGTLLAVYGQFADNSFFSKFESFIQLFRWLAIGVFFAFLVVDGLLVRAQVLEKSRISKEKPLQWESGVAKIDSGIDFGVLSIALINFPMLIVSSMAVWLSQQIVSNTAFHTFLDTNHLGKPFPVHGGAEAVYCLFVNGLDAGIVSSTMLMSQMIYSVLQVRWGYLEFQAEVRKGQAAAVASKKPDAGVSVVTPASPGH